MLRSTIASSTRSRCMLSLAFSTSRYSLIIRRSLLSPVTAMTSPLSPLPSPRPFSTKVRSVEDTYVRKSAVEHVLLRPDLYIGAMQPVTKTLWVWDVPSQRMVWRDVTYVPAFIKIFDEILVNAADNAQREPSTTRIDVQISAVGSKVTISVRNNGKGIPVVAHRKEHVYVPELVFGHLLTSSNFDDSEARTTGGRMGFGAKLTNIFSHEFSIDTLDGQRGLRYRQRWSSNMTERHEPVIEAGTKRDASLKDSNQWPDYTSVTFAPDLRRFGMSQVDADVASILTRRVYDIAACLDSLSVSLNGHSISLSDPTTTNFEGYMKLFSPIDAPAPHFVNVNKRWQVGVMLSHDAQFSNISFVNAIATIKGGTHVNLVTDQITKHIAAHICKTYKNEGLECSAKDVRPYLCVFVNAVINNPAFDSQTKETLTTKVDDFGSSCKLSTKFLNSLVQESDIVTKVVDALSFKQKKQLVARSVPTKSKTGSRLLGIPKLDDANEAGGPRAADCTLILTEGDSAKSLAVAGLSVIGRDLFGVFPLKGKLLNVRDASHQQLVGNVEVERVVKILGLDFRKTYEGEGERRTLRYGRVMVMTDQDHDGSHIKGLFINLLHCFWPALLQQGRFLEEFITPIVKAKHKKLKNQTMEFFTIPEYDAWKAALAGAAADWDIKYYKGLGTNSSAEGKIYFSNLYRHRIPFVWSSLGAKTGAVKDDVDDVIDMAFRRDRAEDRRAWLCELKYGTFLDHSKGSITLSDFINQELILFSQADLRRNIPSLVDGLKPGQRKVLYACFKRRLTEEMKVAQLAGYISEVAAYHHGEQSLHGTIVNMAQDFTGANNLPLLVPSGQFGTRLQGGKDAASARYIFTRLQPYTRLLFPEADDVILKRNDDDGYPIEPEYYIPIIPLLLANGAEGVGTGWSTSVPCFDVAVIIENVRRGIKGEAFLPMLPSARGFQGTVIAKPGPTDSFLSIGCASIEDAVDDAGTGAARRRKAGGCEVLISELPIGRWTDDYKTGVIEPLISIAVSSKEDKAVPLFRGYKEYHSNDSVCFRLQVNSLSQLEEAVDAAGGLTKLLRLESSLHLSNMHVFDSNASICKMRDPLSIVTAFLPIRMDAYHRRKESQLQDATRHLYKTLQYAAFTRLVSAGEIEVRNRRRDDIVHDVTHKITKFINEWLMQQRSSSEVAQQEHDPGTVDVDSLLSLPVFSLTTEALVRREKEVMSLQNSIAELTTTSVETVWLRELAALELALKRTSPQKISK